MSKRKICSILIKLVQVLLLIWTACAYVKARMELMEARSLISGLFTRDTTTRELLREGADKDWVLGRLSTNQHFVAQYAVRRNVMRADMHAFMHMCYKRGDLDLNEEQLKWFEAYREKCLEWQGDGRGDRIWRVPVLDLIEIFLYSKWSDRAGLWLTWKPGDLETNIKPVPSKKTHNSDPVSERMYRSLERKWPSLAAIISGDVSEPSPGDSEQSGAGASKQWTNGE